MSAEKESVAEFVRLTEPCHRQLFGIALSLCRDRDQASDLVQDALVRALESFDSFHRGSPVLPWLRRILRNLFLDSFKTGRARHEVTEAVMDGVESAPDPHDSEQGADPLTRVERAELSTVLREEIASLEPEHQQVLQLCVMQDLAFEEAAEMTGLPVGTVASRLARARAKLRDRMLRRVGPPQRARPNEAAHSARPASMDGKDGLGRRSNEPVEPTADGADVERPDRAEEAPR